MAALDIEEFVVTWTSYYPRRSLIGPPQPPAGSVDGQQFDAQGNRIGSDFLISPSHGSGLVSSLTNGGFVNAGLLTSGFEHYILSDRAEGREI